MLEKLFGGRMMATLAASFLFTLPVQAQQATDRSVTFQSGSIEMAGRLVMPAGPGPHPAIVFVHGSGPMTREGFAGYADAYAQMGIASLAFDKRGTGESGGDYDTASLDDWADDLASAIAFMEQQPRIDRDRVGVWGISQAGWVVSRSMGRGGDADFVIMISGGGAGPLASEMHSWEAEFAGRGLEGELLERAREMVVAYYAYFGNGEGREALVAMLEGARGTPLQELGDFLLGRLVSADAVASAAWVHNYDPVPDIARITGPVLLLFGDRDNDHPTPLAIENWRRGLGMAGNDDVSIVVFPGAGHGIRLREGWDGPGRAPFADGYREVMIGWLWSHILHPAAE